MICGGLLLCERTGGGWRMALRHRTQPVWPRGLFKSKHNYVVQSAPAYHSNWKPPLAPTLPELKPRPTPAVTKLFLPSRPMKLIVAAERSS